MAQREEMLALVRRAYAARDNDDAEGLVAAFHPKGQFALMGDKAALELTGSVEGHASLRGAFSKFIEDFGFEGREILAELVDGDRIAIHSRVDVRYRPTGKVFSTEILDLFRLQDGKIVELIEFADTAQVKMMIG